MNSYKRQRLNKRFNDIVTANTEISIHQTHHLIHAIITLFTLGCWIPFWLCITIKNIIHRKKANEILTRYRLNDQLFNINSIKNSYRV